MTKLSRCSEKIRKESKVYHAAGDRCASRWIKSCVARGGSHKDCDRGVREVINDLACVKRAMARFDKRIGKCGEEISREAAKVTTIAPGARAHSPGSWANRWGW